MTQAKRNPAIAINQSKPALSGQRMPVVGDHRLMSARETDFGRGARTALARLKRNVPGTIGLGALKRFGVTAIGALLLAPERMLKATPGSNSPTLPARIPSQYPAHRAFESGHHARMGRGHAGVEQGSWRRHAVNSRHSASQGARS